jgi:uncharacterized protein YndB with AHSA1/START domain
MNHAEPKHQLEVSTPTDREIVMTRAFNAPRERVFAAFTKPELIARWLLGPDGWSMLVCDVDLRPGGAFHYVWRNETEDKQFGLNGDYHEVTAPKRIVHAERFDQSWYPGDAHVTTTFDERDAATTVTMQISFDSRTIRDQAIESGMTDGVAISFDRLENVFEQGG